MSFSIHRNINLKTNKMLKFKNKVEQITYENVVGDYKVGYRFQLKEGVIELFTNTNDYLL